MKPSFRSLSQFWSLAFVVLVLFGCYAMGPKARYDIRLAEVQRPADAKERYGEQLIERRSAQGDSLKYWFEDSLVSVLWVPTTTRVYFLLTNKADHSIKIIWDEAAFLMPSGESRRVVHSGVKYTDANSPQPPSVVPRGGKLDDFVVTSDQCYYISGRYGGWNEAPFLPSSPDLPTVQTLKGKTFSVLLPLQIEGVTNEYQFTFSIDDVILPTAPAPPPGH